MTSFVIKAHLDRQIPQEWWSDADCMFCMIIRNERPSHKVYENEKVIVILDVMPLRPGHVLVIPKAHYSRLSDLPDEFASAIGLALTKVAKAVTYAVDNTALNVVCNQEYAQAVPHVHYHVIPAPRSGTLNPTGQVPRTMGEMHQMEVESRGCLDEEDAKDLLEKLQAKL